MQDFITEELIWALHRERVNAGVRQWLAARLAIESREENPRVKGARRLVPFSLRPARCC